MANIQLNYYDGSTYIALYPKVSLNNNDGTALSVSYVPNLDASKITSGTFSTARIPNLPASQITTGTFGGAKGTEYIFPGNIRIGGTGSSSDAYIRIGDGDYIHFHEDSDDNLTIKAKRINFLTTSTPGLTNNGVAIGESGLKSYQAMYTGTGTSTTITGNTGFATKLIILVPSQYHQGIFAIGLSNISYYGGKIFVVFGNQSDTIYWRVTYNSTNVQFSAASSDINMASAIYCYICIG